MTIVKLMNKLCMFEIINEIYSIYMSWHHINSDNTKQIKGNQPVSKAKYIQQI